MENNFGEKNYILGKKTKGVDSTTDGINSESGLFSAYGLDTAGVKLSAFGDYASGCTINAVGNYSTALRIYNNNLNVVVSSVASYTKVKTIIIVGYLTGAKTFLFDIKNYNNVTTVYGQIRRNGIALGTEQTTTSSTYITKSESITQIWSPGDTCELWVHTNGVEKVSVKDFRIAKVTSTLTPALDVFSLSGKGINVTQYDGFSPALFADGYLEVYGNGQNDTTVNLTTELGASINLIDRNVGSKSGGMITFGANNSARTALPFSAIKGLLNNGSSYSIGELGFFTRKLYSDATLTLIGKITSAGIWKIGETIPNNYNFITAPLMVRTPNQGITVGSQIYSAVFQNNDGNNNNILIGHYRVMNGDDWLSDSARIQQVVDSTKLSYISFMGSEDGITYKPSLRFGFGSNTDLMTISYTGKVGIKVTAPSYFLSLDGSSDRTIGMEKNSTTDSAGNDLTILTGGATNKMVATVSITDGGTGYTAGDILTLAAPVDGASATVTVSSVAIGVVDGVTLTTQGSNYATGTKTTTPDGYINTAVIYDGGEGYTVGDYLIVSGGDGNGAVIVDTIEATGYIDYCVINAIGTDYVIGDHLTVAGGNGDGILNVDSVDIDGGILGLSIYAAGTGYSDDTEVVVTGGTGTDATVDITIIGGSITGISVDTVGRHYTAGVKSLTGGTGTGARATITVVTGIGCTINVLTLINTTDADGGNLILKSGISTGIGTSDIEFYTSPAGATSAINNTLLKRVNIGGDGITKIIGTLGIIETGTTPTYYTYFQGGDQTGTDITYTLPITLGATGTVLSDVAGNGILSWEPFVSFPGFDTLFNDYGFTEQDLVTLDTNADDILSLSTQAIGLQTQVANTVFAGRVDVGTAQIPTFRALVALDIPDLSGTYLTAEADTLASVTGRGTNTTTTVQFQNALAAEFGLDTATNIAGAVKFWSAGANNYYTTITAAINTGNTTITLPVANPAGTYLLNMTSAGVMGYDNSTYLTSVPAHNLLSATHGDTTIAACARGSIIVGDLNTKWVNLVFPVTPTGKLLQATVTDVEWSTNPLTIGTSASISGSNTGDVTLANPNHGLGLTNQVITMGTPSTCTAATTNAVTTTTHTHEITGFLASVTAHNLLSTTHGDTTASSVARGDLVVGTGASPAWDNLALGTVGKILRSDGTDLLYSTSTFANTYGVSELLYASSANVVAGLATGNSGVLVTSAGGVPSIATDIPTAVTIGGAYIYRVSGTDVTVADGGTNKSSWTQYAIPYLSTTTAFGEIAIGTAGYVLAVAAGATGYEWITVSAAGGATKALDNLAAVAINTSLISDADSTDDLGSISKQWANVHTDRLVSTISDLTIENDLSDGDIIFKVNDGGVDTTVMTLDGATGRVGIGNTAPASLLHLGTVSSGFGAAAYTILPGTETISMPALSVGVNTGLFIDGGPDTVYDKGMAIEIGFANTIYGHYTSRIVHYGNYNYTLASKLQIQTHSAVADTWNIGLFMDNSGYVGLGTVTPLGPLDLGSALGANSGLRWQYSTTNAASRAWGIQKDGYGYGDFVIISSDTNDNTLDTIRLLISKDGNVGINTTAPLSKLSINGGLHVGGDSDAGDNNLLVDGTATVTGEIVSGSIHSFVFPFPGAIQITGTNQMGTQVIVPFACTIVKAYANAGITSAADLIFDINYDSNGGVDGGGSTIWSTQADRLTIAASAYIANTTTFNTTALAAGGTLTIDIDQSGGTWTNACVILIVRKTGTF